MIILVLIQYCCSDPFQSVSAMFDLSGRSSPVAGLQVCLRPMRQPLAVGICGVCFVL